jgi:alpha-mannosidase
MSLIATSRELSPHFEPDAIRETNARWASLLERANIPAEQANFALLQRRDILDALVDETVGVIAGFFYRDNDGDGAYDPGEALSATLLGLPTLDGPDAPAVQTHAFSFHFGPLRAGQTYMLTYDVEGVAPVTVEVAVQPGLNVVHLPVEPTKPLIYVVPHSHFDPEWRNTYDSYVMHELIHLRDRIDTLRFQREHVFVMDEECVLRPLVDRHPELLDELRERVREGAIELKGIVTAGELLMPLGESMIRQMIDGELLASKLLGLTIRPKIFWNVDNYGYSFQMPQILAKAGRPYFAIGEYIQIGPRDHEGRERQMNEVRHSNPEAWNHPDFWLEGLDGSKVLVHRSNYGFQSPGSHYPVEEMRSHRSAFNFRGGDFTHPELELPKLLRDANDPETCRKFEDLHTPWDWPILKSPPGSCQHIIATSEQFFRAIENAPDLPTIQSESWLRAWDGCYETRVRNRQITRRVECLLFAAEMISSSATLAGLPSALEDLREAWYGLLISQHHDPQLCAMEPDQIHEVSQRSLDSGAWAQRVLDRSMTFLTDRMATDTQPGRPVVVFNPLAWSRSEAMTIDAADLPDDASVVGHDGTAVPAQLATDADGAKTLTFIATDVPGSGWKTFYVTEGAAAQTELSVSESHLENAHVRVELTDGVVQKIIEKSTGTCVFTATGTAAVNEVFIFGDEGCPSQIRPRDFMDSAPVLARSSQAERSVRVIENGPARVAVEVAFALEWGTFRQRLILEADGRWVDFDTDVNWYPDVEGGRRVRVAYPWAVGEARAWRDIPFGVIEWTQTDEMFPTNSWVGVSDADQTVGAALVHGGACGQQVIQNVVWQTLFRSVRVPGELGDESPDLCGWDNPGHTALEEGLSRFHHRLHVHAGSWADAGVPRGALALTTPMVARATDRHGGELPSVRSDLTVEGDQLVACTWKQADYTDGTIIRLFNPTGDAVEGALVLGFDVATAEETDFREAHTGDLTITDGRIALELAPYEIKTVRLV